MSALRMVAPRARSASTLVATAVGVALGTSAGSHDASAQERAQEQPQSQASAPSDATLPKISVEAEAPSGYRVEEPALSKFTAPLLDTPQTITIIPQALIQARNATTLRDALRNTSGITFQAGEGGGGLPGDQNFSMRGFNSRSSLFADGIRDPGSYARDTFFIEQVEIAKGPAAVLGGRGATGGLVNQVTKTPHGESSSDFDVSAGTDEYVRATVDLNQPIGKSLAGRLNLMYDDGQVPGRDVVETSRWGVAPSLAWDVGTDTRLTLSYLHIEQDNVPDYGLPWNTEAGNDTGLNLDFSNFYGLIDYDFEDIDTDSVTGRLTHDFSDDVRVEATARWLETLRDSAITAPRPPNRQLQQRRQGNELLALQTNLLADLDWGHTGHRLITGVEVTREDTDNRNQSQSTNQPPILDVANPDPSARPLGPMPENVGNPGPSEAQVDTLALYVFDNIALSERWEVNGGVRWETFDVDYQLLDLTTTELTSLTSDDDEVSWQAGIVYKPRTNMSLYAAVGTSFEPAFDAAATGVALSDLPTQATNPNLDPEESRNYEIGTKWQTEDARLGLTAAVFRTEKFNARTRTTTDDAFTLDGEQEVTGVELSMSGELTEGWSAFAGYVYMDSEFKDPPTRSSRVRRWCSLPSTRSISGPATPCPSASSSASAVSTWTRCSATSPAPPRCRATGSSMRWRPTPSTTRLRCSSTRRTSPTRSTSTVSEADTSCPVRGAGCRSPPGSDSETGDAARRTQHVASSPIGAVGRGACSLPPHARGRHLGRRLGDRRTPVRARQGKRAAAGGCTAGA